jgi:hypothetical protein
MLLLVFISALLALGVGVLIYMMRSVENFSWRRKDQRKDHRCGPRYKNAKCGRGRCCSKFGWCGTSDKHCYKKPHGYCSSQCKKMRKKCKVCPDCKELKKERDMMELLFVYFNSLKENDIKYEYVGMSSPIEQQKIITKWISESTGLSKKEIDTAIGNFRFVTYKKKLDELVQKYLIPYGVDKGYIVADPKAPGGYRRIKK